MLRGNGRARPWFGFDVWKYWEIARRQYHRAALARESKTAFRALRHLHDHGTASTMTSVAEVLGSGCRIPPPSRGDSNHSRMAGYSGRRNSSTWCGEDLQAARHPQAGILRQCHPCADGRWAVDQRPSTSSRCGTRGHRHFPWSGSRNRPENLLPREHAAVRKILMEDFTMRRAVGDGGGMRKLLDVDDSPVPAKRSAKHCGSKIYIDDVIRTPENPCSRKALIVLARQSCGPRCRHQVDGADPSCRSTPPAISVRRLHDMSARIDNPTSTSTPIRADPAQCRTDSAVPACPNGHAADPKKLLKRACATWCAIPMRA